MKYEFSPELQEIAEEISSFLFPHVIIERVKCFRSYGSSSKYTVARCHSLGKIMQKALDTKANYVLEFISENFDKLDNEEKLKTIINELMHIPKTFGGGFKHHDHVNDNNIDLHYNTYINLKKEKAKNKNWFKV